MAVKIIDDAIFTNTANAIRAKGVSGSFTPAQMPNAISSIETGATPLSYGVKGVGRWNTSGNATKQTSYGILFATITKETMTVRWRLSIPCDYSLSVTDPGRTNTVARKAAILYNSTTSSFSLPTFNSYNTVPTLSTSGYTTAWEFSPVQPAGSSGDAGARYEGSFEIPNLPVGGDLALQFYPTLTRYYLGSSSIYYYPGQLEVTVY